MVVVGNQGWQEVEVVVVVGNQGAQEVEGEP